MADEPTWDDLFGSSSDEPVRRAPANPPAAQPPQQPVAPAAPVQSAPTRTMPTQPSDPFAGLTPPPERSRRDSRSRSGGGRSSGGGRPPRRRRLTWLWVLLVVCVLGVAGSATVWSAFQPQIRHIMGWEEPVDYKGSGDGKAASVTIVKGQFGSDIAKSLQKAGVVKTSVAFYNLLLKQNPQPNFEPGTYKVQEQMSAKAALSALLDPKNRIVSRIVIPEGSTAEQFYARLSAKTGVSVADFEAAAKNYTALGVPANAPSIEGFLFPATYSFDPGTDATTILKALVARMYQSLDAQGVAPADRLKVLTLASIVQREGGSTADFYKVARVFQNRLDTGMKLESDATVNYGAHVKTVTTTGTNRADASNPYNTYAHAGLPIGPIASPGDDAIKAALHPVAGPWLYFVLVNGDTKETTFSTTLAQQNAAVKVWQAWLKAHPGYGQ
jgi:UPF0755 protein